MSTPTIWTEVETAHRQAYAADASDLGWPEDLDAPRPPTPAPCCDTIVLPVRWRAVCRPPIGGGLRGLECWFTICRCNTPLTVFNDFAAARGILQMWARSQQRGDGA